MKVGRLALLAAFALFRSCVDAASEDEFSGSILPRESAPGFVKEQWRDVVRNGMFSFPKRDWTELGLPPGLEEQVWSSWRPGSSRLWRNISPGYANVTYDAKVDGGVISLLLDGAGLVQSKDAGLSWAPVSHHLTSSFASNGFYSFDISPANPEIIAVAGARIDKTLNGGRSWTPAIDQALPPFAPKRRIAFGAVRFNADGARVFAANGAFGHGFGPRRGVEPEMAKTLKRKTIYAGDGEIANFKAVDLGDFAGVRCILPHFSDPDLVYASFSDGTIYACRNARAETPVFSELSLPDAFKGFQAISMDVSPESKDELLIVLLERGDSQNIAGNCKSKLVAAKLAGDAVECQEIKAGAPGEAPLPFAFACWNPRDRSQSFVGLRWGVNSMRVSDDGMKTFKAKPFPKGLLHAEPGAPDKTFAGYACPRKFLFDRKSDLCVALSTTGGWFSHDLFKTMDDLLISYDEGGKLYGNKGVGFAECGVSICVRKNFSYVATNDHGAWRSDGADCGKWLRISSNPGMPSGLDGEPFRGLAFPMGVSDDEAYVYLVARMGYLKPKWDGKDPKSKPSEYSERDLKLMLSRDMGSSWRDVTSKLGMGETFADEGEGGMTQRIFFDPKDSRRQWITLSNKIFFSLDGGRTFNSSRLPAPLIFRSVAYDPVHKILYAATRQALIRSLDFGATWSKLPFEMVPYAVGVLSNGDLVVSDDGRLMVVPFDKIDAGRIEQSMIRMTIGDSVPNAACGQRTFRPILCDGMNVLTFTSDGWNCSDATRDLGPLLSEDGGRTFRWIVYDLPFETGGSVDMRDGRIILGSCGIHMLDLKSIPSIK